jgi:hypothetical protein
MYNEVQKVLEETDDEIDLEAIDKDLQRRSLV